MLQTSCIPLSHPSEVNPKNIICAAFSLTFTFNLFPFGSQFIVISLAIVINCPKLSIIFCMSILSSLILNGEPSDIKVFILSSPITIIPTIFFFPEKLVFTNVFIKSFEYKLSVIPFSNDIFMSFINVPFDISVTHEDDPVVLPPRKS